MTKKINHSFVQGSFGKNRKKDVSIYTLDNDPALPKYINEIGPFKPLTQGEEILLAKSDQINELVIRNLLLVVSIAKQTKKTFKQVSLMDLIQYGNEGLKRAAKKFDPSKGKRFSTYATWWIQQSINKYARKECQHISIPISAKEKNKDEYTRLTRELNPLSLDSPLGQTNDEDEWNFLAKIDSGRNPESEAISNDLREKVRKAVLKLDYKERELINKRFGLFSSEETTLQVIADSSNLTRSRIGQKEKKILQKLRKTLKEMRINRSIIS